MVPVSYTSKGNIYDIIPITDERVIDADIQSVLDIISDTDVVQYRSAMVDSVDQNLAYAVYENGIRKGFVYNRVYKGKYYCASIKIDGNLPMIIALRSMFEIADYRYITFAPHEDNLKYFKSMISGERIRSFYSGVPTVTISKKKMWEEGIKLFKYWEIVKL